MRLKGLDGIRALCALLLLWGHIAQKDFVSWEITRLPLPECVAYVFLAISGVLAGYRINSVHSMRDYYAKKARRILPLYYSYILITIVVFILLGRTSEIINTKLFYYLFLVPSIPFALSQGILPLVHLWFIGTLVLFYLCIPLFAKLDECKKKRYALTIAAIWFIAKMIMRIMGGGIVYRLISCTSFDVLFLSVWCGLQLKDGISIGGAMAVVFSIIAWCLFLLSGLYGHIIPAPVRIEFISALSLIIIVTQQRQQYSRLLENQFARFLGSISYEIYVGQILLIILVSQLFMRLNPDIPDLAIYMTTTLSVVLFAYILKVGVSAVFNTDKSLKCRQNA